MGFSLSYSVKAATRFHSGVSNASERNNRQHKISIDYLYFTFYTPL